MRRPKSIRMPLEPSHPHSAHLIRRSGDAVRVLVVQYAPNRLCNSLDQALPIPELPDEGVCVTRSTGVPHA